MSHRIRTFISSSITVFVAVLLPAFAGNAMAAGGTVLENDYILIEHFRDALNDAMAGDTEAQYSVARMYEKGMGARKDMNAAFDWYEKAGAQNHKKALYRMGYYYLLGTGVSRNFTKAFRYMTQAANLGYSRAQYYLAAMYKEGIGVTVNLDQARRYYQMALDAGELRAQQALASLDEKQKQVNVQPRNKRITQTKQSAPDYGSAFTASILRSEWLKGRGPAPFMPSSLTTCREIQPELVECLSGQLRSRVDNADIIYETKTLIRYQPEDGGFQLSYRNNVINVDEHPTDDAANNLADTIKVGWQEISHKLACHFEDQETVVVCQRNRVSKMKFTRADEPDAKLAASNNPPITTP